MRHGVAEWHDKTDTIGQYRRQAIQQYRDFSQSERTKSDFNSLCFDWTTTHRLGGCHLLRFWMVRGVSARVRRIGRASPPGVVLPLCKGSATKKGQSTIGRWRAWLGTLGSFSISLYQWLRSPVSITHHRGPVTSRRIHTVYQLGLTYSSSHSLEPSKKDLDVRVGVIVESIFLGPGGVHERIYSQRFKHQSTVSRT